ncbi:MAG TPA: class I SAM-dependent methyltransferase, partial [Nitrospiria bacterium]|nr:class I SAM-dependent methyltransferase [Nitrospiria bacterium]
DRASDEVHSYAYRKISDYISGLTRKRSPVVIDYACGIGNLLTRLMRRIPEGQLYGYDGSSLMLETAQKRIKRLGKSLSRRVCLAPAQLPDFSLPRGKADMVVYCFPHIVSEDHEIKEFKSRYPRDKAAALFLTRSLQNSEYKLDGIEDKTVFESSLTERVVSRNLRGLVKKGGLCVRVDYAENEEVEVPAEIEERISDFEDGTLDETVNGIKLNRFFKSVDYDFFRSSVVLDVYEQTREDRHLKGGYYISVLKAV